MGCLNVTTNYRGIPYLTTTNVTVSETFIDYALGFRNIQPVGYFTVRIANDLPADADTGLPVRLTLNGTSRELTFFDGTPVTGESLAGTGVILVFNDRINGILQLMSVTAPAA